MTDLPHAVPDPTSLDEAVAALRRRHWTYSVPQRDLPVPLVDVSGDVRALMRLMLAAVACGRTPEQIADYLDDGEFPPYVAAHVELDRDEFDAWVDLLLVAQQSPSSVRG